MKNGSKKFFNVFLVVILLSGMLLVLRPASAAELPPEIIVPSTVRALVNTHLRNLDDEYLSTFTADAISGNGLNGPVIVWWYHFPDAQTGDVYMLVASQSAGKVAIAARLGAAEGVILGGVEKKDANNVAYTLLRFTNVWLVGNEIIHINMGNGWNTGQAIIGRLNEYFPQLVTVTYFEGGTFYRDLPLGYSDPIVSGTEITIADITTLPRYADHAGYTFSGWAKSINGAVAYTPGNKLAVLEDMNLYAVWIPRNDLNYIVEYRKGSETGDRLLPDKTETGRTFGVTYTETAPTILGYNVDAISKSVTIAMNNNKIIFIYTARTDLSYVVNYLEQGTDAVLAVQKSVVGQTFGAVVTE
ncbi:MAG: InlB B-repeat-containing protein, partial [Nitrososphaerota archaeon]|nr:InlB B-repeat-containing protein [Nitrososphaerota archaeon]